jgi:HEAT repeat protein
MAAFSNELINVLLTALEQPPPRDRFRDKDDGRRRAALAQLAASRNFRVVPALMTLVSRHDSFVEEVVRAITHLVEGIGPAELSWLDEELRSGSHMYSQADAWWTLSPGAVPGLARIANFDPTVVGLLASHPNGFVRAAALEQLSNATDGREIPFLAVRANDWVDPVATRAAELLAQRLHPANRTAVLDGLPFLARTLGQRRRNHAAIAVALRSALLSDGVEEALARTSQFDTSVRRFLYDLISRTGDGFTSSVIQAALKDSDAVIRARAISRAAFGADVDRAARILEHLLRDDPVSAVRKLVLTVLAERLPDRIPEVVGFALLDRAPRVRDLARFVVGTHHVPIAPRDFYIRHLNGTNPRQLTAAIDGIGETGHKSDLALLEALPSSPMPSVRRAALRAFARLDADAAIPLTISALRDDASSVRRTAVNIIRVNSSRVDFHLVNRAAQMLSDPRARRNLLRLLKDAPKWDSAIYLLEALADPDESVRLTASRLLNSWVADFNRRQTLPNTEQLERIRQLVDSRASLMPIATVREMRFMIKAE